MDMTRLRLSHLILVSFCLGKQVGDLTFPSQRPRRCWLQSSSTLRDDATGAGRTGPGLVVAHGASPDARTPTCVI